MRGAESTRSSGASRSLSCFAIALADNLSLALPCRRTVAMRAYVINLEGAVKRWKHIEQGFSAAGVDFIRVPAIDGNLVDVQESEYSPAWYRLLHGRETNPPEIGCYLSHLKALRMFLETDAELALICEDDITLDDGLATVLQRATDPPRFWNILRLTGVSEPRPLRIEQFVGERFICINLARSKGTGAYVVDRKAAEIITSEFLPMKLPYDHALDREWFHGFRAACVLPFPITQKQKRFGSSIQTYAKPKLPFLRRCFSTYPYQALNEITRWIFRTLLFVRVKLMRR
jgi:glycosyl transferase family 25